MKNRFLISLWAACGLLLVLARPVLGQAPTFTEAISFNPSAANGISTGTATAINVAGDQYVTGFFTGTIALGSTTLVSAGSDDIFVAKRSGSTGAWFWAMRAGGTGNDASFGMAVDAGGNALVTGVFAGTTSFASSPAAINLTSAGNSDVFVAKFASTTGAAAWAVRAGGTGDDLGFGVAVDAGGNALVTGDFEGRASFSSLALVGGNGGDTAFLAKLQAAGPSATTTGANKTTLTLAPNPTCNAATLTLPAAAQARAVTVADALGRVVRQAALPAQATALTLDVAGLAPGVYSVRCETATARLLVE